MTFYRDVLGFDVVRDERTATRPYVAFERGGARLGAAVRSAIDDAELRRPPVGVELVLEVEDLSVERSRVAAADWPVEEDLTRRPWGLSDFRLLDPDGYYWRLTGPISESPSRGG